MHEFIKKTIVDRLTELMEEQDGVAYSMRVASDNYESLKKRFEQNESIINECKRFLNDHAKPKSKSTQAKSK